MHAVKLAKDDCHFQIVAVAILLKMFGARMDIHGQSDDFSINKWSYKPSSMLTTERRMLNKHFGDVVQCLLNT